MHTQPCMLWNHLIYSKYLRPDTYHPVTTNNICVNSLQQLQTFHSHATQYNSHGHLHSYQPIIIMYSNHLQPPTPTATMYKNPPVTTNNMYVNSLQQLQALQSLTAMYNSHPKSHSYQPIITRHSNRLQPLTPMATMSKNRFQIYTNLLQVCRSLPHLQMYSYHLHRDTCQLQHRT